MASLNARASGADMLSIEGSPIVAIMSSMMPTSGCSRRTTPSLHCVPVGPVSWNPRYPLLTTSSQMRR